MSDRDKVLEEAARVCEADKQEITCRADRWAYDVPNLVRDECAQAIRALKGGDSIAPEQPTRDSERAALVAEVGDCCKGADPLCVEKALEKRAPQPSTREDVERDAMRYRWLRDRDLPTVPSGMTLWGRSNRLPHITQYPYQSDIDKVKFPQVWEGTVYRPENLDAAIDAAMNSGQSQNVGGIE